MNPSSHPSNSSFSFKDRHSELAQIHRRLQSPSFELIVLFGRRRVGKTLLSLESTKKLKTVYYLARRSRNLEHFKRQCVKLFPRADIIMPDFEALIQFLHDKVDVIIIDEFPYILEEDAAFIGTFQAICDNILQKTSVKLILVGSAISVMKNKVLNQASPLYGRKTASMRILPHSIFDLHEYFPETSLEEQMQIFGCVDGIPYYLTRISSEFWSWMALELQTPDFLRDEGFFLIQYEFSQSERYFSILEAISMGKTQISEIANFTHIPVTALPQYVRNLMDVEFIRRQIPITAQKTSKRGIYLLQDNFLKFWFRFIYPNLESIDQRLMSVHVVRDQYSHYMGSVFEQCVQQFLVRFRDKLAETMLREYDSFLKFTKIGRWWWKDVEIDLIAFDPSQPYAIAIECKWQDNVNPKPIATTLIQKLVHVHFSGEYADKTFLGLIFAKSFCKVSDERKSRDSLQLLTVGHVSVIAFDLDAMQHIMEL